MWAFFISKVIEKIFIMMDKFQQTA